MKRKLLSLLAVGIFSFCAMTDCVQAQTQLGNLNLNSSERNAYSEYSFDLSSNQVEQMGIEQLIALFPQKEQAVLKKSQQSFTNENFEKMMKAIVLYNSKN